MKRHENQQDEELQRRIDEQEMAMSELLLRVMDRPLTPLHKTIEELRGQIAAVQQANIHAAQSIEAGLSEVLEGQSKRLNRHVNDVADVVDRLKEELAALASTLDERFTRQVERDEHIQDRLAQAGNMLAQLDAKADLAGNALVTTARDLANVGDTLGAAREEQQVIANRLSQELGGLGERLEQHQVRFSGSLGKATAFLEQIRTNAAETSDSLAAATRTVAKVDAELGILREQEQASSSQLNGELHALMQQLDRQQVGLCDRIDAVKPELTLYFETLSAAIDHLSKEAALRYETLSETQKALMTATVQEQLALQLAPFRIRTKWLIAVCGLSFASTLALLGMQLLR